MPATKQTKKVPKPIVMIRRSEDIEKDQATSCPR